MGGPRLLSFWNSDKAASRFGVRRLKDVMLVFIFFKLVDAT